jgi:hypothetical protein
MMIAIIILGLGLVMVATMFPVAWDRARDLSEYTIEQTTVSAAQSAIESVVRPAGLSVAPNPLHFTAPVNQAEPATVAKLSSGSLAGDLFYDPELVRILLAGAADDDAYRGILFYSDTRVHALHMENLRGADGKVAPEEPWRLELMSDNILEFEHPQLGAAFAVYPTPEFVDRTSFYRPQVRVSERIHAPLDGRPLDTDKSELDRWNDRLSNRRFCWAILHRLREPVGPRCEYQDAPQCLMPYIQQLCGPRALGAPPLKPTADESRCLASLAAGAAGSTRNFDVYYVTLRRPQSTHRYARQDPTRVPDPYQLDSGAPPAPVSALGADSDVMLPVAWRVQVQLPATLSYKANATGVPTEITVPPPGLAGNSAAMVVSMFPQGTRFVDEITGLVLRVTKRRVLFDSAGNQSAVLTLDREIVQEEINIAANDLRVKCASCTNSDPSVPPDPEELLRTVWVYPPPIDTTVTRASGNVLFDGSSPVVGIDVRTLSIAPQ